MQMQMIDPGVYRVQWNGKTYLFSFLSPTCVHFFEEESPKSPCVTDAKPLISGVQCEERDDSIKFSHGDLVICLDSSSHLKAELKGKVVLDAMPYFEGGTQADLSLAEKEGHASTDGEFGAGGIRIESDRPVYGLGERSGPLDKRGYDYINWNTDDPSAHVDTFKSLYQSIPFAILFDQDHSVGVFLDNTYKSHFDCNKTDPTAVKISYSKGCGDYYFFFGSLPEICAEFTSISGRNPLCPYWALGAQQSRWSYPNAAKVDEVIRGYRERDLPLSVVYLDIDYMDAYKDFTVDGAKFPNLVSWLAEKKEQGITIVPIIDAGVKAEEGYFLYDEGMANGFFSTLNGDVYHNEVWPGDSVFPAFLDERVQEWWATHIQRFLELGFGGIWNDMNEPASFRGPLPLDVEMGGALHEKAHNVYGHFMAKAGAKGFEKAHRRLFQLTRAGYAGTCRFSSSWAGDNQSIYDHLRMSLPQMMNMSLSGQAYIGVDIGGFGGDTTPELLTKWAVASLFNPLYRNHSALGTMDQEPYLLKDPYLGAYRQALKLRYALRPMLYTELYFAEILGNVALRPLIYNYPEDERVINENTEVMLGKDLLLIPSLFPGETKRNGYFPDAFVSLNGQEYETGDHIIDVGVGSLPLFYRKDGLVVLEEEEDTLRLLSGCEEASTVLYEDEGDGLGYRKGIYNLYEIRVEHGNVEVRYLHHGITSRYRSIQFEKTETPFLPKEGF